MWIWVSAEYSMTTYTIASLIKYTTQSVTDTGFHGSTGNSHNISLWKGDRYFPQNIPCEKIASAHGSTSPVGLISLTDYNPKFG